MKRMISLLLIVLLLLSGCSSIPDAYGGPALDSAAQSAAHDSIAQACIGPGYSYHDYDEYLKFVKSVKWPYGFVEWSDLEYLEAGEWIGFGLTSPVGALPDGTSYWYGYIVNGVSVTIHIDHTPDSNEVSATDQARPVVSISDEMTSMRMSPNGEESAVIERSGLKYIYDASGLSTITWVHNGVEYTIHNGNVLRDYPTEATDTFIGRLLSLNDADLKLALAEIKPDLETE